jgi:hypothetical protein
MQGILARAFVEAFFLMAVYTLAENLWCHQPILGNTTGLLRVDAS